MTAEIVNLRQARKAKARRDKESRAGENRLAHGRSKAEKTLTRALNEKAERRHEQGRLDNKPEGD